MFSHSNNAGNSASAGGGSKQLALSTGERFVEQYYEGFFKSSGGKFYQPTTKVIWNGNGYNGEQFKTTISK
ncbi:hypothetical protein EV174_000423 [Coemansia sp. RSA 2320]|nr:hypothetical protein EV174_000423 [Coemansia sp. RSA 2320]